MPSPNYVSLAEQGYRPISDTIQDAARNFLLNRQLKQKTQQEAEAFPIEQQQRQATAEESTKKAAVIDRSLALQAKAQELQNEAQGLANQFLKETDPIKKDLLTKQAQQISAQIQNLQVQGDLLKAQTGETQARTGFVTQQGKALELGNASSKITPGALDPYGNQVVTTTQTNPETGAPLRQTDTFERGRGIPRVAYKQVWDPQAGLMKRIPGVVQIDDTTGSLNVQFPDEPNAPQEDTTPDNLLGKVVDKFFDASTGKRNDKTPSTAQERAQLNMLLHNPGQIKAYGLDVHADVSDSISTKPSAAAPVSKTQSPTTISSQPVDAAVPGDRSATAKAGIKTGGEPAKTGGESVKTGGTGKFGDLPVGATFMQNGVKFRKTGDKTAVPADEKPAAAAEPSLPKAGGM